MNYRPLIDEDVCECAECGALIPLDQAPLCWDCEERATDAAAAEFYRDHPEAW
jgi:hypothetical protein